LARYVCGKEAGLIRINKIAPEIWLSIRAGWSAATSAGVEGECPMLHTFTTCGTRISSLRKCETCGLEVIAAKEIAREHP
jgi:hypothetical protein